MADSSNYSKMIIDFCSDYNKLISHCVYIHRYGHGVSFFTPKPRKNSVNYNQDPTIFLAFCRNPGTNLHLWQFIVTLQTLYESLFCSLVSFPFPLHYLFPPINFRDGTYRTVFGILKNTKSPDLCTSKQPLVLLFCIEIVCGVRHASSYRAPLSPLHWRASVTMWYIAILNW